MQSIRNYILQEPSQRVEPKLATTHNKREASTMLSHNTDKKFIWTKCTETPRLITCCNYAVRELKLNELTWWTQGENCPWDRSLYSKFVNLQHSLLTDTRHTWETCYQRSLITTLDRFREFAPIVSSATWSTQSLELYIVLTLFIADTPFS